MHENHMAYRLKPSSPSGARQVDTGKCTRKHAWQNEAWEYEGVIQTNDPLELYSLIECTVMAQTEDTDSYATLYEMLNQPLGLDHASLMQKREVMRLWFFIWNG